MLPRRKFVVCLATVVALGACSRAELDRQQVVQEPPIANVEFILEIFNPQPRTMSVTYTFDGSAITTLGLIAANETKRWAIPNQGSDQVRMVANDTTRNQKISKTLDLDKGKVVRWEIRE